MNTPGDRQYRLVIAEDDERLRTLVCMAAERTGRYSRIEAAPDGRAALELVTNLAEQGRSELPDIILTDLSMPRMDGIDFIRNLKRHAETAHIPVAVMTSSNRPNDREDAFAAGCCAFFAKPATLSEIVVMVGSLIEACEQRHPLTTK